MIYCILQNATKSTFLGVVFLFLIFIIMLVYVPILYLEGVEGKMFRPMAGTVLLALGGSLIVALFLMPALALR